MPRWPSSAPGKSSRPRRDWCAAWGGGVNRQIIGGALRGRDRIKLRLVCGVFTKSHLTADRYPSSTAECLGCRTKIHISHQLSSRNMASQGKLGYPDCGQENSAAKSLDKTESRNKAFHYAHRIRSRGNLLGVRI